MNNQLFTIESLWESEAYGFALLAGKDIGLTEAQLKELEDRMRDHVKNTSRETAREVYYENK